MGPIKLVNPVTFHRSACTNPVNWAVMYMWLMGIEFWIGFWNCGVFSPFYHQHHSDQIIDHNLKCQSHVLCVSVFVYIPTFHFFVCLLSLLEFLISQLSCMFLSITIILISTFFLWLHTYLLIYRAVIAWQWYNDVFKFTDIL